VQYSEFFMKTLFHTH